MSLFKELSDIDSKFADSCVAALYRTEEAPDEESSGVEWSRQYPGLAAAGQAAEHHLKDAGLDDEEIGQIMSGVLLAWTALTDYAESQRLPAIVSPDSGS